VKLNNLKGYIPKEEIPVGKELPPHPGDTLATLYRDVGTIKHHPAHPASKTTASATHDGKATETSKRLRARKTEPLAPVPRTSFVSL